MLDGRYAEDLASIRQDFDARKGSGCALTDLAGVARAATFGAIETLLVDIDAAAAGSVDETSGALAFAEADTTQYDVLDEIAGRALNSGARVLGVRSKDIPGGGHVAALLRYPV